MSLKRALRPEPQARVWLAGNRFHIADKRTAMADRIAVGDFLVLVRVHEQPGPGAAEDRLHVGLQLGTLLGSQAAVDQLAVIPGGCGHIKRALLASFHFEARDARSPQGRYVIRAGQIRRANRTALAEIAPNAG